MESETTPLVGKKNGSSVNHDARKAYLSGDAALSRRIHQKKAKNFKKSSASAKNNENYDSEKDTDYYADAVDEVEEGATPVVSSSNYLSL